MNGRHCAENLVAVKADFQVRKRVTASHTRERVSAVSKLPGKFKCMKFNKKNNLQINLAYLLMK